MNTRKGIKIFAFRGGRSNILGYSVVAVNRRKRRYILSCTYTRVIQKEGGKEVEYFPLIEECRDMKGKLLRYKPVGVAKTRDTAGSAAYAYTRKQLFERLGRHIDIFL